ncbi:MAG: hypothetical protein QOD25_1870, partial [Alphaproteobacteria bacterium]|nr:hypothetical protein [Alphaproteobacteria bacterium]
MRIETGRLDRCAKAYKNSVLAGVVLLM